MKQFPRLLQTPLQKAYIKIELDIKGFKKEEEPTTVALIGIIGNKFHVSYYWNRNEQFLKKIQPSGCIGIARGSLKLTNDDEALDMLAPLNNTIYATNKVRGKLTILWQKPEEKWSRTLFFFVKSMFQDWKVTEGSIIKIKLQSDIWRWLPCLSPQNFHW